MLKNSILSMLHKPVCVIYDNKKTAEGVLDVVDGAKDVLTVRGIGLDDIHVLVINIERIIDIFLT